MDVIAKVALHACSLLEGCFQEEIPEDFYENFISKCLIYYKSILSIHEALTV